MKNIDRCIYCGKNINQAPDHVPPKNLFPKPRPSNLITVSSCYSCNKGYERDDEYFKSILLMRKEVAEQERLNERVESLFRSWGRKEARGFLYSFEDMFQTVELKSPSGIYLGKAPAFTADNSRLERVVKRITRGLYFHHHDVPLPDDCQIIVWLHIEKDQDNGEKALEMLSGREIFKIGNDIFTYLYATAEENKYCSMWFMVFYDAWPMLSMTRSSV